MGGMNGSGMPDGGNMGGKGGSGKSTKAASLDPIEAQRYE